jgi:hypothetical protein
MPFLSAETAGLPEKFAERVVKIHESLSRTVAAIRNDPRLTPEAKRQDIAKVYISARSDMATVSADLEKHESSEVDRIARRVFGNAPSTGSDVIAARDADDRAARITSPDEAAAALARAEKNQDQILARAIALRASEEATSPLGHPGWSSVLASYSGSRPGVASDVETLAAVTSNSTAKIMSRGMIMSVDRPGELGGLTNPQLAALAGQTA